VLNNPGLIILKRAFLFIDGSNFYHSLKQQNLLSIFSYKDFVLELSKEFDIQRVFFYDAIKDQTIESSQYSAQQAFHQKLIKEIPNLVIRSRKLKYLKENLNIKFALKKNSFCEKCFKKINQFLLDAGLMRLKKEKGVDVMLVCDLVKHAFQNEYDTALLASGDADFVPAVELVQQLGKQVTNLHFYSNSSTELRNKTNNHGLVYYEKMGIKIK